jgi:1-acyl-sn-glycerol-3-phosphate acyltransferase
MEHLTAGRRAGAGGQRSSFPDLVKWVRVGFAGLAFLGFWAGAMGIAVLALPLGLLARRKPPRRERAIACQRWIQRGFTLLHDYMRVSGLLHFNPRVVDPSVPAAGFVIISNHPTLVDVAAVSAVFGSLTCVAKTALFRAPFVGHILRAADYMDGGAGDPFSAGLVVNQGVERVRGGMPVLIFPEGTRSPEGGLRTFKRGAFEIACRANVPVLPLVIRCNPPALGKGRPWYDIPRQTARFTMARLEPLHPIDFGRDPVTMARACETIYRRELGLDPPGDLSTLANARN